MKNSMKRRLQIRFVLISMAVLFVLLGVIVTVSIYNGYSDMAKKSDVILEQVRAERSPSVRYFSVKVNPAQRTVRLDAVQHVSITQTEAAQLAGEAIRSGKEKGFVANYRYHVTKDGDDVRVWFLSRDASMEMLRDSSKNLIIISSVGFVVMSALLIFVSGLVVAPIVENHRKQKQFITAASHELKTPLTVISTDMQLLRCEVGDNEWIDTVLTQVEHMTRMTHGLVALARAEELDAPTIKEEFSLSDTTLEVLDMYAGMLEKGNIHFGSSVSPDVIYTGDPNELHQLLCALLDNAFKYCPKGGSIAVTLKKERRFVYLSVFNTTEPIAKSEQAELTQRFYRGRNAAQKEGFGLGLSIVDAIAKRHKGTLTVSLPKTDAFLAEVKLH